MNVLINFTKQVQRIGAVALIACMALLGGCSHDKSMDHIPIGGVYVERMTGKSFALVFSSNSVDAWENYGGGAKSSGQQTCLSKGSTYTVNGLSIQVQGGAPASVADPTVPFNLAGGPNTVKIAGGGIALQLPVANGKVLTFMRTKATP